jgi:KUP system potassium uptake protein
MTARAAEAETASPSTTAMGLAALGVVFGDIGTSPLYTLKTVLAYTGPHPSVDETLGALSLILWTLFVVTTVKYVNFAMRVDNDGEGGIIALMSLIGIKKGHVPAIVAVGLFGAALIYGDGAITPAISVLSALEGVEQVAPGLTPYVLPAAVAILLLLFALQPLGTAKIGRAFGPVMLTWFVAMALLGLFGIAQHPSVVAAINPYYGFSYLFGGGLKGFLVLGGVFLCVTGAEALYADMGHFGARPIGQAWNFVVLPSLFLNYAGQAAIVLEGAPTEGNIFYRLCPSILLTPLILLATVATVIASQSIITGAFSMTRQAIQLGWLPRLRITQTSEEGYGQIYVGAVNWLLMLVTLALTVGFGKSDNLASAYGIAVAATMLMTSVLLFIAMREIWGWSIFAAGAVAGVFVVVDASFLAANLAKLFDGGYVPLLLAAAVYFVMWTWHHGMDLVRERLAEQQTSLSDFARTLESGLVARVPGTAVFLTRTLRETPPVLSWHVAKNRALHEKVLALTLIAEQTPRVAEEARVKVYFEAGHFWRAEVRHGFMQRAHMRSALRQCEKLGADIDLDDVTYYVGRETIVPREGRTGLSRLTVNLFIAMARNGVRLADVLKLPHDQVVEIGREISI